MFKSKDLFFIKKMDQNKMSHIEWEKENSLTSPEDRNPEIRWRPEQGAPVLTNEEVELALQDLNNDTFIRKYTRADRNYVDPAIPGQTIGLVSFTPAKGASPNKNGIYGFCKLRGNFATAIEANERAEFIIRNVDSWHQIYHAYVGRPFPMTINSKYSAETSEIDMRKEVTESTSQHIKQQKLEEQKLTQEIKDREEELLRESEKARNDDCEGEPDIDTYDRYITLAVKKAQLSWTFLEHLRKLDEVRSIIVKTRKEIAELDEKFPEYKDQYFEKYREARVKSGLDENIRTVQDNFMKYMVEEAHLPTIDTDEVLPRVPSTQQ